MSRDESMSDGLSEQDQAALSGVLNTLYDLHLPLLNVECIDEPKT